MAQRVFQLHQLDKEIVFWVESWHRHRRLEIEAQPLLYAQALQSLTTLGQIQEKKQIQHDRRRQNRGRAYEIHLDLHGIAQPAKDVNVVPAFLIVAARRVVINADRVVDVPVEIGIKLRLQ